MSLFKTDHQKAVLPRCLRQVATVPLLLVLVSSNYFALACHLCYYPAHSSRRLNTFGYFYDCQLVHRATPITC
jgi:hypothetical protein